MNTARPGTSTEGTGRELADRDGLFNNDKSHLRDFGGPATQDFLRAVASDKDSYETVSAAQQVYGSTPIARQALRRDGPPGDGDVLAVKDRRSC